MRAALSRTKNVLNIPSALIIAALLLTNTANSILEDVLPTLLTKVMALGALLVITVFLTAKWNHGFVRSLSATEIGQPGSEKMAKRRGAVVILGFEAGQINSSVAHLLREGVNLEYLALIGTPETAQRRIVQEITEQLMPLLNVSFKEGNIHTHQSGNAESLSDTEQAVYEAIEWMERKGLSPADVVVDISYGRRPMIIGASLAADAHSVETQYRAPVWDHLADAPLKGKDAFKVIRERYDVKDVGA